MGDYFIPQPGQDTTEIEPPDITPPNFSDIGKQLGAGLATSGAIEGFLGNLLKYVAQIVTYILALILKAVVWIAAYLVGILTSAEAEAETAYGDLVVNTVRRVLGVETSRDAVGTRDAMANNQQLSDAIGAAILGALFAGAPAATGNGVPPSSAASERYLSIVMKMAVNGWLEAWLTDALSLHELEKFGDLKDIIERSLGLGRMARQVFAAPLHILCRDPYTALLNQKYRPRHVAEATAMRQLFRGELSRQDLSQILGNQGYTERNIDWLIQEHTKYLPDADVDYLVSHGTWTQDDGLKYLQEQGWDTVGATHRLELMRDRRIDVYRKQMVEAAAAAFVKNDIAIDQWQRIITTAGLSEDEQTWLLKVTGMKQEMRVTHLSRADIERGILDGILNLTDLKTWALRENMPPTDEAYLELMVLYQMSKQTASEHAKSAAAQAKATAAAAKTQAAAAKAAAAKAQAADKGISVAAAEALVIDGHWTFDQLTAFLTAKGYGADAIDGIEHLLHVKIDGAASKAGAAGTTRASAKAKGLTLAEVEKAVVAGVLSSDELAAFLANAGYDQADAQVIIDLTALAVEKAQAKAAATAAAHGTPKAKAASLADVARSVRLGLSDMQTYTAALTAAGYDQADQALLVGLLNAEIAADRQKASTRAAATGAGTSKGVTLAQLEHEVIAGVRPIADYTAELAQLGYSVGDQRDLTELLQLRVDQAHATAAKRAAAGQALTNRGISLADAERAVKLGVVPITTYTDMLASAGFTAEAINVLRATLLASVSKTTKAQTAANQAATSVAGKALSLAEIERAVIAGVRPIADYSAAVTAAGYSGDAANTLVELVQLKAQQGKRAAAVHSDAEGRATARGLNLAQEEAAVIANDKTTADFDAFLTTLGYDAIDRATLAALLQDKITAAAAKATKTKPGATSGTSTTGTPPATTV